MNVTPEMFLEYLNYELPHCTSIGCYPIVYYVMENNCLIELCAGCATVERTKGYQVNPLLCDIYWEGPNLECQECGKKLESAYGDPEENENLHRPQS